MAYCVYDRFGRFLVSALVLVGACSFAALPAIGAEENAADQGEAEVEKALAEKIDVSLLESPFARALENIERQTKLNIVIDPRYADKLRDQPVTLRLTDATTSDVLDLVCLSAQAGWMIEKGVVFVTTADEMRRRRVETRVYDIRSLLFNVQNQVGPTFDLNQALSNTSSGGSDGRMSKSRGRSGDETSIFGVEAYDFEDSPTRVERIEQIVKLIDNTVGSPEEWDDMESSLSELNGNLVVKTTPENHDQIDKLLSSLEETSGRLLMVRTVYAVAPTQVLDAFFAQEGRQPVLDKKGIADLTKQLRDAGGRVLGSARNVGFNQQRVFVYAGEDSTFLSDIEPVPDADGFDTTISLTRDGVVLDVLPTISMDGDKVVVAIKSDVVTGRGKDRVKPIRMTSRQGYHRLPLSVSGPVSGTVEREEKDDEGKEQTKEEELDADATLSGKLKVPTGERAQALVELDLPAKDLVSYRTTVRVPNGGGVVLGAVSETLLGIDPGKSEVVMILAVEIIE